MKNFIFLVIFIIAKCSFPIQEKYQKAVLSDIFFIHNQNKINNLAVSQVKNYEFDKAEKNFKSLIYKKTNSIDDSFLNLFHLYFILDEYNLARNITQEYLNIIFYSANKIKNILKTLEKQKRNQEKIIFLDVLFQKLQYKVFAGKKIGKYFLEQKKYEKAFFYYDKVLVFSPLDKESRLAMIHMAYNLEKWEELLKFVTSFEKSNETAKDLYYFAAKANYELGNYYKALYYIRLGTKKKDIFHLKLWEDIILSIDLNDNLKFLNSYKNQISHHNFIYNIPSKNKKNIVKNLLIGF